ncbi:uncharacterized protein Z518_01957 [Rhinocladiella mackenziei CBS 650.93]|uniref:Rhinocladiella mackenziei CBS 650.93 unplaced genomic scaffold supercont1.2, whole genome shotgun sequence n=1 Tax=Rhinocladiella mackenziei CBS 650.93 TaxID=1442369 RepID=A0A0D2IN99_9EURO|nr:uncharacterized protein Z518_01957 [Rhinocladiella mackenziei CBS 650.93]KIX07304.1 hypothetical protein Z518_01957 [Rhinocladiella mackenziei CBS 650.93]
MAITASVRSSSEHRSNTARSRSSTRKPESYDASALTINPSPLLTSSLHSRNSATSAQESAYLAQTKWLRWTRLVLIFLTIATSTAAVGCAGHVLQRYNVTHLGSNYNLHLWPRNVDIRPTLAILVPATVLTAVSLVYLAFSLIPTPYSRTLLYNIVFLASSVVGLVLCLFAIPFNLLLVNPSTDHPRESLQSWTCKFSNGASQFTSDARSLQIPVYITNGMPIPAGFKRLCTESQVSVGLMIAVLALEVASCAVAVMGCYLEKKVGKARKERYAHLEKGEAVS